MRRSSSVAGVAFLLALTTSPVHAQDEMGGSLGVSHGPDSTSSTSATDLDQMTTAAATSLVLNVPPSLSLGSRLTGAVTTGTAAVDVDAVTLNGGTIRNGLGLGGAAAFDYPSFAYSSSPPLAVLRVSNATTRDDLSPGNADFTFGADFTLDSLSTGSPVDNGNNLIQRGLHGSPSQYKIDVDDAQVACRIKGSTGSMMVKSTTRVRPGIWYRARCSRVGQRVQLDVTEYLSGGSTNFLRIARWGNTGSLLWPSSQTPLSVGGKLTSRGAIVREATDQFNGLVGKPMLTID